MNHGRHVNFTMMHYGTGDKPNSVRNSDCSSLSWSAVPGPNCLNRLALRVIRIMRCRSIVVRETVSTNCCVLSACESCLPAMLYGVEVCALKKSQTESLQFAVNSSFMKIFNTKSMNVVSECLDMFNMLSVADYIVKRKCKFLTGYINSQNSLCNLLCRTAKKDLSDMTLR